jgi:hypothetical protein
MLWASPVSSIAAHSSSLLGPSSAEAGVGADVKRFWKSVSRPDDDLAGENAVFLGKARRKLDDLESQAVFGRGSSAT